MNEIGEYADKEFTNKALGKWGKEYIDKLNQSNKALDYYVTDYTQYMYKWEEVLRNVRNVSEILLKNII